jgi:hypothetical protein
MDALPQDIPALPPTEMSDLQLGEHFKAWGSCSKAAMRRALSLLPEIAARGIHRKEGFQSLREYAAKLAGASAGVVEEVMRLHRAIGHLPELWGLLATGQAGWSILRTFAPIANPENAAELATLATRLSRREAQDYVKSLDPTRISAASSKLANNSWVKSQIVV